MIAAGGPTTGKGVRIAIIDSGIDRSDPRLIGAHVEGCSIELGPRGLGTSNLGKAPLFRDCVAHALDRGSVVVAAAHPKGERAFPADLPEAVGVAAHPDCPIDQFFYFDPDRYSPQQWGVLSGKFLTHGCVSEREGGTGRFRGPGLATAYLSGHLACLVEALPGRTAHEIIAAFRGMASRR